jgi:hypothetical protein
MAPEQARSGAKLRRSTDVWPLGLLAYLLQRVRQDVMSLSPTAISQCLWAVGKSLLRLVTTERHTSGIESMQQTVDALATELVARGPLSLAPQVLATSCYGIAKGGYVSARLEHLFDAVEEALCGSTQQQQPALTLRTAPRTARPQQAQPGPSASRWLGAALTPYF